MGHYLRESQTAHRVPQTLRPLVLLSVMLVAFLHTHTALLMPAGLRTTPAGAAYMAAVTMTAADDNLNDGAACVKLEPSQVPDCMDPDAGDVYACSEPPAEDASLTCFQLEDEADGQAAHPGLDGKSWVCTDRANVSQGVDGEEGF